MILVVAAILYLSYFCSRKLGGGGIMGASKNIKVVDKAFLGKDKSVAIIRVGGKDYLLGIAPEGIRLLKELEEGQVILEENEGQKKPPRFSDIFRSRMGGGE